MAPTAAATALLVLLALALAAPLPTAGAKKHGQATVIPPDGRPTQTGFLPVNASLKADLFYAYYEAQHPTQELEKTPVILWLQGGPGCSSMVGNFYENGPYVITEKYPPGLKKNPGAWNRRFGVLYIDNPIGVGFSRAHDPSLIPRHQIGIARNLYVALTVFFTKEVPKFFQNRPFFIAGESYGGKYIPSLGYYTLKWRSAFADGRLDGSSSTRAPLALPPGGAEHADAHFAGLAAELAATLGALPGGGAGANKLLPLFRLDGLLVGNGMTDPKVMIRSHAPTSYYFGLVDGYQRDSIAASAERVVSLIDKEDWIGAANERKKLLKYLKNAAGLTTLFNIQRNADYHKTRDGKNMMREFLARKHVQEVLGIPKERQGPISTCTKRVSSRLRGDLMKSVSWMVNDILSTIPVLLYQGQLDMKEGPAATEDWIQKLDWPGKDGFMVAERVIWRVRNETAGYIKEHANLTHVTVLRAGHMSIRDQPVRLQHLVEAWVAQQLSFKQEPGGTAFVR